MSTEPLGAIKIDRLSSLPPELLSTIFSLAYGPEHLIPPPLSRALLPYCRQALYRDIRLTNFGSLFLLFATTRGSPALGSLIVKLNIKALRTGDNTNAGLRQLLKCLPSLRSLSLPGIIGSSFSNVFDDSISTDLPLLESLSFTDIDVKPVNIRRVTRIFRLKRLKVRFLSHKERFIAAEEGDDQAHKGSLDSLEELALEYLGREETSPWNRHLANFVDSFPYLTRLTLGTRSVPLNPDFLRDLDHLSTRLKSLTLKSWENAVLDQLWGDLFPRFQKLERLDLGDFPISAAIISHIGRLPHLSYLRLGKESQNIFKEIATPESPLRASKRIGSLKTLVLDSESMDIGKRVDTDEKVGDWSWSGLWGDGWREPSFYPWEDYPTVLDFLVSIMAKKGIKVTGNMFELAKFRELANLERGNRLVLETYNSKDLAKYKDVTTSEKFSFKVPHIDVDSLDPENLKLIKIDLPEQDWFQFSLE
ncbi:hypothetical protein JCM5350_003937 [Sporobolomyces pararoseus]